MSVHFIIHDTQPVLLRLQLFSQQLMVNALVGYGQPIFSITHYIMEVAFQGKANSTGGLKSRERLYYMIFFILFRFRLLHILASASEASINAAMSPLHTPLLHDKVDNAYLVDVISFLMPMHAPAHAERSSSRSYSTPANWPQIHFFMLYASGFL